MSEPYVAEKNAEAAEDPSEQQSAFLSRLSSYAVVNSTWNSMLGRYQAVKEYNPYLKAGIERAEGVTMKAYETAAPVVVPVLANLNERYALDEKGVHALEKAEQTVEGITKTVTDAKNKAVNAATGGRDMAVGAFTATKSIAFTKGHQLVTSGNRPLNHLLDLTEIMVDKILPPDMQQQQLPQALLHKQSDPSYSIQGHMMDSEPTSEEEARLALNPITRATHLTLDVGQRVRRVAEAKLGPINFRSPAEIAEMTHVVDLIQYAAQFIDVETQRARLNEAVDKVKQVTEASKAKVTETAEASKERVQSAIEPVRKLIEDRTSDVKDVTVKSTVALVAAIANATEVVRRRISAQADNLKDVDVHKTREGLRQRLVETIDKTKASLENLSEADLLAYVQRVRSESASSLAHLVSLIQSSSSLNTIRTHLTANVLDWTNSLVSRLGYAVVPLDDAIPMSLPLRLPPQEPLPETTQLEKMLDGNEESANIEIVDSKEELPVEVVQAVNTMSNVEDEAPSESGEDSTVDNRGDTSFQLGSEDSL